MEWFVLVKFNEKYGLLVVSYHLFCLVVETTRVERADQITQTFAFDTNVRCQNIIANLEHNPSLFKLRTDEMLNYRCMIIHMMDWWSICYHAPNIEGEHTSMVTGSMSIPRLCRIAGRSLRNSRTSTMTRDTLGASSACPPRRVFAEVSGLRTARLLTLH